LLGAAAIILRLGGKSENFAQGHMPARADFFF